MWLQYDLLEVCPAIKCSVLFVPYSQTSSSRYGSEISIDKQFNLSDILLQYNITAHWLASHHNTMFHSKSLESFWPLKHNRAFNLKHRQEVLICIHSACMFLRRELKRMVHYTLQDIYQDYRARVSDAQPHGTSIT